MSKRAPKEKVEKEPKLDFSEHEKLKGVRDKSQACGEFLEWLGSEGYSLCRYDSDQDRYYPSSYRAPDLLARFFDIDQNKLEKEKREMLDMLRGNP